MSIGWSDPELCVRTNDYLLESVARFPERIVPFCAVQPNSLAHALSEIERCAIAGARGIGELRPDAQGFDLTDKNLMAPIVEALLEHDLILMPHASEPVGHQYYSKGKVTPEILYPFLLNFPELKVILPHWGGGLPFYALMPEVKKALSNTYFDTAATPLLYHPRIFEHVTKILGADRLLFGTDYPVVGPDLVMEQVESTSLTFREREKILGDNAVTLLGITRNFNPPP